MTTHERLKCRRYQFRAIRDGRMSFEIRKNDRDYQVGDTLNLWEWDNVEGMYTRNEFDVVVTFILDPKTCPLIPEGCVGMSIASKYMAPRLRQAHEELEEVRAERDRWRKRVEAFREQRLSLSEMHLLVENMEENDRKIFLEYHVRKYHEKYGG